jgi:hypothetical protein
MPGIIGMPGMPMQQPPHGPQPQQPAEAKNTNTKILYNIYTFVYVRVCVSAYMHVLMFTYIYKYVIHRAKSGPSAKALIN